MHIRSNVLKMAVFVLSVALASSTCQADDTDDACRRVPHAGLMIRMMLMPFQSDGHFIFFLSHVPLLFWARKKLKCWPDWKGMRIIRHHQVAVYRIYRHSLFSVLLEFKRLGIRIIRLQCGMVAGFLKRV